MILKKIILPLSLAACISVPAGAQSVVSAEVPESSPNFVEIIEEESGGNIEIDIPDSIMEELLKDEPAKKRGNELHQGINKINGYRIQVFSDGTNQHSLESRARARGNAIVARFPKYRGQVYAFSSSPNWYTRIGNFQTQEEAASALIELKQAFPQYAGEMRIVKSQVVIIK